MTREVTELEQRLHGEDGGAALAVLERWQWDEMLDDVSRARARRLVSEFRRLHG